MSHIKVIRNVYILTQFKTLKKGPSDGPILFKKCGKCVFLKIKNLKSRGKKNSTLRTC